MRGLMMDFPLVIPAITRRAEALFRHKTIATRRPDRSIAHATYGEMLDRVRSTPGAIGFMRKRDASSNNRPLGWRTALLTTDGHD